MNSLQLKVTVVLSAIQFLFLPQLPYIHVFLFASKFLKVLCVYVTVTVVCVLPTQFLVFVFFFFHSHRASKYLNLLLVMCVHVKSN